MTRPVAVPDLPSATDPAPEVQVTVCPGGPLLVRGADVVRDQDGAPHDVTRPVVAVCACGKSQRKPWCDGTHKVIPDR
jgi:hypothetical protein